MKTGIIFLFAFFFLHLSFVRAQDTVYVPQDYTTIQQGIDAAVNGNVVLVDTGTYYENINFMGKAITLASKYILDGDTNHIDSTIIDGSQPANPDYGSVVTFLTGEDTTSVLYGFTISSGSGTYFAADDKRYGGGVICYYAGAKIMHNKIINNEVVQNGMAGGGGVACYSNTGTNWIILKDNFISGNSCVSANEAAFAGGFYSVSNAICHDNEISFNTCIGADNSEANGGGIFIEEDEGLNHSFEIKNNHIHNNSIESYNVHGAGLVILRGSGTVEGNIISYNSGTGVYSALGGGVTQFYSNGEIFFKDNEISHNVLEAERPQGGGIIVISASDSIYIQDNLIEGNEVTGSYICLGGGITLIQNAGVWLLDNHVVGNALLGPNYSNGAGIFVDRPLGNTIIRNNLSANNSCTATGEGGGLSYYNWYSVGHGEIEGNVFENNEANEGGGVWTFNCYDMLFSNNVFTGNNANSIGGGIMMKHFDTGLSASFSENEQADQHTNQSGREILDITRPLMINNTFMDNSASNGGAIYCDHQDEFPLIVNSIFWENLAVSGSDIYYTGVDSLVVSYCNINTESISGIWKGEENINKDPLFIDDSSYHLSAGSPCIRQGIDSLFAIEKWWYCPINDFDGENRPFPSVYCDPTPDIGADEVEFDCVGIEKPIIQNSKFKIQTIPNPTGGISDFRFQISDFGRVTVMIFDIHGREIAVVLDEKLPAGEHVVQFDASSLPDGIYLVRVMAGSEVVTGKIVKVSE